MRGVGVNTRLYISHFLSTWNSRVFEFGAVLFIASAIPGSLLPPSVYALVRSLSAIFLSPVVGRYIDNKDRLHVVRLSILSQRLVVAASCIIFYFLLIGRFWSPAVQWMCLGAASLLACVEKLGSIMNRVSVERDWVIVVSADDEDVLRTLNAQMRRIDLVCKLVGPLFIALVAAYSIAIAILTTLGWNLVSVIVEYGAIAKVYDLVPALQISKQSMPTQREDEALMEEEALLAPDDPEISVRTPTSYWESIKAYSRSPMFLPSLALSLLYLTVLSFNGQMVTYLLALPPFPNTNISYNAAVIGGLRTFSTLSEISATFLSPLLMSRIGPIRSGLWAINEQIMSLLLGTILFVVLNDRSSSAASFPLIVSVILSRMGLWSFDLSVQLQIQQIVPKTQMGAFSTIETSLQNTFELLAYVSTIVFSRPEQFQWPAVISCVAVTCAGGLYARYVRERRGHLIHWSSCLEVKQEGYQVSDDRSERILLSELGSR